MTHEPSCVVSKNEVGTFACVLYGLCACCGYSETGSCLVSARATRTYASGRVGMKLKFSASTRPGFYRRGGPRPAPGRPQHAKPKPSLVRTPRGAFS